MDFEAKIKEGIKEILSRYPVKESAIIPCLHLVQDRYGYISEEHFVALAKELDIPASYIYSSATFYTMFNLKPMGKYHLQVCRNISCSLLGAHHLIDHLSSKLGIKPGETSTDGRFTLSLVECLGACGAAPVMMVNEKYYENMDAKKIDTVLKECK